VRWLWLVALIGCGRLGFGSQRDGSTSDGGGGGDGAAGDVGDALVTGSSVCPSTVHLADDFEDGVTAAMWTVVTATDLTVAETAGVLRVTYASNSSPTELAGYREAATADYSTVCVIAEITAIPSPSAQSASSFVRIGTGPSDNVAFDFVGGNMHCELHNGASVMVPDTRPFDPVAHRFVRLRMTATDTFWEASPDGVTFTLLGTVADNLHVANPNSIELMAQTNSASQNAGKAEWASVQVLVPP